MTNFINHGNWIPLLYLRSTYNQYNRFRPLRPSLVESGTPFYSKKKEVAKIGEIARDDVCGCYIIRH